MADRVLNARTIHTHDIESNWEKCSTFIPKQGELIVYDIDDTYSYQRFKIGDGVTSIANLPFAVDSVLKEFLTSKDDIFFIDGGRISSYEKSS